ncbi:DOT1-domain-containing protein [Serendipita vermifera]|nr:DOT1-domain-containing protein [Serendipita vermifera]
MLESMTTTEPVQYPPFNTNDATNTSNYSVQLASSLPHIPSQSKSQKATSSIATAIPQTSTNAPVKKRKRDASSLSISEKRPRFSATPSLDLKRGVATRESLPSPSVRANSSSLVLKNRAVNRLEVIPRQCISSGPCDSQEFLSSYEVVKNNLNNFRAYFLNKVDPYYQGFTPEYMPYVDLEYPVTGVTERYALLAPKDEDGWHPVKELMDAVEIIVKFYLPAGHTTILGEPREQPMRPSNPKPTTKHKLLTPLNTPGREASPAPTSRPIKEELPSSTSLLKRMRRTYELKDGIGFICVMKEINSKLRSLKKMEQGNALAANPATWEGMPFEVAMHIYEETYQRSAGPRVKELKKYPSFSSNTYGELNSGLVAEMCHRSGLKPGMKFLDLGCGIGNVVIQSALLAGCLSAGVENFPTTANIGAEVHQIFKQRCQMWGVEPGLTENADVILANNFVFEPTLNEGLKRLFLDLKDGAKIISLRSFCDDKVSARNIGAIESFLDVESFDWYPGDVSWGDAAGQYFISTINRTKVESQHQALFAEARSSRRRK